jgi:multidrug resistance efflux pump
MSDKKAKTELNVSEEYIEEVDTGISTDNKANEDAGNKMRKITQIFLVVSLLFAVWYLIADRLTPSTSQARVRGYIVKVASEIPGKIEKIHVVSDQYVEKDELLFEIEQEPYLIAIQEAEAALEDARQQIGGDEKGIAAAEANVVEAKVRYETALKDAKRAAAIAKSGAIAARNVDIAYARVEEAKAGIAKAEAGLEEARKRFGKQGTENTKFKKALAQLEQARLNLTYTTIKAPYDGVVSNMQLEVGHYASPGAMLVSFISTKDAWVEGYLRENNLGNIKTGNKVEIALDSAPGRVFSGVVESVSYGVKWNKNEKQGELASVTTNSGWLRDPQRFPVVIKFIDDATVGFRREGGQADIIIYTSDSWVMNLLGKLWVRIITMLSFVY